MKKIIILLPLFLTSISFSQQLEGEIKLKLNNKHDVFQIVDETKKQVSLFFSDEESVKAYQFNSEFKPIDSLLSNRPEGKFKSIIGYACKNNKYRIFWASNKNKEISSQCFDFESKKVSETLFKLNFSKEQIIQQVTVNNSFYIISLVKKSNVIKFYIFDNEGNLNTKMIDAKNYTLMDSYSESVSLYDAFKEDFLPFEESFSLKSISPETPTSLTFAAFKRKMYTTPTEIIFTFDTNPQFTQLYKINLTDFSISRNLINQPREGFPENDGSYSKENFGSKPEINSNSFIINDKIFQIKLCSKLIKISVKDLEGNEIKEFSAKPDQYIDFKNSEIIQENGSINNKRILDSSDQFIRKLYISNPGITCFQKEGNYYLTIGSASEIKEDASGAVIGGILFGAAGAIIVSLITANQNIENFSSYQNRQIIYINSIFDSKLNHVSGDLKPLAFDQLRSYVYEIKKSTNLTIFKFNSFLYLGSYNKKTSSYSFNRFEE